MTLAADLSPEARAVHRQIHEMRQLANRLLVRAAHLEKRADRSWHRNERRKLKARVVLLRATATETHEQISVLSRQLTERES